MRSLQTNNVGAPIPVPSSHFGEAELECQGAQKGLILLLTEPPAGMGTFLGIRGRQSRVENTERTVCYQILVSKPDAGGGSWAEAPGEHKECSAGRMELLQAQLLNSSTDPREKNTPSPLGAP